MASAAQDKGEELKKVLPMLRAIVQSSPTGVRLDKVAGEYRALTYQPLPFRALGFSTLELFLRSVPDTVQLERKVEGLVVKAVADSSTAKLQRLIDKQKKPKVKKSSASTFRRPAVPSRGSPSFRGRRGGGYSGTNRYTSHALLSRQAATPSRGGYSGPGRNPNQPHLMASPQSHMVHMHAVSAAYQRTGLNAPQSQIRPSSGRIVTVGMSAREDPFPYGPPPPNSRTGTVLATSTGRTVQFSSSPSPAQPTPSGGSSVSGSGRPPKPTQCNAAVDVPWNMISKRPANQLSRITGYVMEKPHEVMMTHQNRTGLINQRPYMTHLLWERFDSQANHPDGEVLALVYQAPCWDCRTFTDPLNLPKGTQLRVYGRFVQQQKTPHFMVEYYEKKAAQMETSSASSSATGLTQTDSTFEEQIRKLLKDNGLFFDKLCSLYKDTYGRDMPTGALKRLEAMQSVRVEQMHKGLIIIYPISSSPAAPSPQTKASTTAGMASVGTSASQSTTSSQTASTRTVSFGKGSASQPTQLDSGNVFVSSEPVDESDEILFHPHGGSNYKTMLQNHLVKLPDFVQNSRPEYHVDTVDGQYRGHVVVLGKTFTAPLVRSIKLAEFAAAKMALRYFTGKLATAPVSSVAQQAQLSIPSTSSTPPIRSTEELKSPDQELPPPTPSYIWDEIANIESQYIDVHVTHINGPYDIFARWYDSRAEYDKLEADLEERFSNGQKPIVLERPRVDGICLICAPNKLYYRGKIQSLVGTPVSKAEVFCLDHGDVETVELSSVFELPRNLYKPPFQAFLLSLNDVAAKDDAAALLGQVIDLTANKDLVAEIVGKVPGSSRLVVELWNTEEDDININAVLRDLFTSMHSFTPHLPDAGERVDVYVSHVSKSGREIAVQMVGSGHAKLDEIREKMKEHFSTATSAKEFLQTDQLHEGKVCCARYSEDRSWYRAIIMSACPEKREAEVCFMDYGNSEVVPLSSLRDVSSVESGIFRLPAQAISCVLHDLPEDFEMSNKAKEFVNDVIMDDMAVLQVVEEAHDPEPASVQLFVDYCGTELNCNDEIWYLTKDEAQARTLAAVDTATEDVTAQLPSVRLDNGASEHSDAPAVNVSRCNGAALCSSESTDSNILRVNREDSEYLPSLPPSEEPSDNESDSAETEHRDGQVQKQEEPAQFKIAALRPAIGTEKYTVVVFPSGQQHNPGNFVVSVGADSWGDYETVEEKMVQCYSRQAVLERTYAWQAGQTAAARTTLITGADTWVRVCIEAISGDEAQCFALDYGNTVSVQLANLRPLLEEFCQLPSHAVRGCLHGISPANDAVWSADACALFTRTVCTDLVGTVMAGFTELIETAQPNRPSVYLHLVVVPESEDQADINVNQLLINAGHASPSAGH